MSGLEMNIRLSGEQTRKGIELLLKATGDLKPLLADIGEYVAKEAVPQRIIAGGPSPDGKPWASLSPAYQLGKKGKGILRESGQLLDSFVWQLRGNSGVVIGTVKIYAAIHQFGGKTAPHKIVARNGKALFWKGANHPVKSVNHPGSVIPARPFLGLSLKDKLHVLVLIRAHLQIALGG